MLFVSSSPRALVSLPSPKDIAMDTLKASLHSTPWSHKISKLSALKSSHTKDCVKFGNNRYIRVTMDADSRPFEDEVIQRELQRERELLARHAEEEAAEKERANDKARKEMREWSKLRPRTEVKLSKGDILKFGDEEAVFVVEPQEEFV